MSPWYNGKCGSVPTKEGGKCIRNAYIPPLELAAIRKHLTGRDAVITDILLSTGYRLDDVLSLRRWQLAGAEIVQRERKTGRLRTAQNATPVALTGGGGNSLRYAFPALRRRKRRKMHRTTYWRHFAAAVKAAGYDGRGYTPHSLRKVYAVEALKRTGSLEAVRADLGHTSIGTTALYAFSDRMRP